MKLIKDVKINVQCVLIYIMFAAIVITPKILSCSVQHNGNDVLTIDAMHFAFYFLLGVIVSVSMIIPEISGSLMLKVLGYYELIITQTIGGTFESAIPARNWDLVMLFGSGDFSPVQKTVRTPEWRLSPDANNGKEGQRNG